MNKGGAQRSTSPFAVGKEIIANDGVSGLYKG
jgi:hypothetical protein